MPVNKKLADDNFKRYVYARDNGHIDYLDKAKQCEDFFAGLQWEEKIRKRLERQGKPVMTINKILSTLTTVMGEQLQNRVDVTFTPFRNGTEETASALAKVYLNISNDNDLDSVESEVFDDGIISSRGFYDVRMSFDDHLKGEVDVTLLNPHNVIIDSDAKSYDPDEWSEVFVTKWLTPDQIELEYGKQAASHLKMKDQSEYGYDSIDIMEDSFGGEAREKYGDKETDRKLIRIIERQFFVNKVAQHFVDPRTGDTRVVPSEWDEYKINFVKEQYGLKTMRKKTRLVHWRVTADDYVLHDAVSPYKHFTVVPFFPYFRRGTTIGLVENLINPQEILNKVSSQELHVLNSSANGGWKVKRGSLTNMDPDELERRGAETGLVLELNEVGDAEKIQPNQIPTGLDRVTYKMDEYVKDISGVSDSARGFDRADVAAKAIEAKQAAGSVNLAKPFDNLNRTRKLVARRILSLIQTFYTEERILQVTGGGASQESEQVVVNQTTPEGEVVNDLTVGEYSVVISNVPTRESYMESQFEEALRLREMGVPIGDEFLIENSTLARKNEILQAMQDSGAQQRQQMLEDLDIQEKQLELRAKEVEMARKEQEAKLAAARAEKTAVDSMAVAQDMRTPDQNDPAMEYQLEREKMMLELQLEREKMMMEMELKREEMRQNQLLKRAEAQERLDIERSRPQPQAQPQQGAGG